MKKIAVIFTLLAMPALAEPVPPMPCTGQLSQQQAQAALAFIGRVEIKGTEAPLLTQVAQALQAAATQEDPACMRAEKAELKASKNTTEKGDGK
jgi:hypothetical protein